MYEVMGILKEEKGKDYGILSSHTKPSLTKDAAVIASKR